MRGSPTRCSAVSCARTGRNRPAGRPHESAALVARTDELNRAAERYFASFGDTPFLLGKPFTDNLLPRYLFSLGVLLDGIRLHRSDVVAELGAGTCWVSHFINRFGCKTMAIDVSATALDLGRRIFERDPATIWDVGPEFLTYDGHRLPLADGACTKVVIFDAFHHVPNQREILHELARVLTPDGIVGMSEPGLGHASTERSRADVDRFGVLENELVVEDLAALARDCGFADARLIVASPHASWQIPADELDAFMQGHGFARYWERQGAALRASHYLVLYKGDPTPTTRQPTTLDADIRIRGASPTRTRRGRPTPLTVDIFNAGETRWLAADSPRGGWTRLGVHLHRADGTPALIDHDWMRVPLPGNVAPYETVTIAVVLPPIDEPGRYRAVFDLVIEGATWFAQRGSRTCDLTIDVEPGE